MSLRISAQSILFIVGVLLWSCVGTDARPVRRLHQVSRVTQSCNGLIVTAKTNTEAANGWVNWGKNGPIIAGTVSILNPNKFGLPVSSIQAMAQSSNGLTYSSTAVCQGGKSSTYVPANSGTVTCTYSIPLDDRVFSALKTNAKAALPTWKVTANAMTGPNAQCASTVVTVPTTNWVQWYPSWVGSNRGTTAGVGRVGTNTPAVTVVRPVEVRPVTIITRGDSTPDNRKGSSFPTGSNNNNKPSVTNIYLGGNNGNNGNNKGPASTSSNKPQGTATTTINNKPAATNTASTTSNSKPSLVNSPTNKPATPPVDPKKVTDTANADDAAKKTSTDAATTDNSGKDGTTNDSNNKDSSSTDSNTDSNNSNGDNNNADGNNADNGADSNGSDGNGDNANASDNGSADGNTDSNNSGANDANNNADAASNGNNDNNADGGNDGNADGNNGSNDNTMMDNGGDSSGSNGSDSSSDSGNSEPVPTNDSADSSSSDSSSDSSGDSGGDSSSEDDNQ